MSFIIRLICYFFSEETWSQNSFHYHAAALHCQSTTARFSPSHWIRGVGVQCESNYVYACSLSKLIVPHYSSWLWCWTIRASQKM